MRVIGHVVYGVRVPSRSSLSLETRLADPVGSVPMNLVGLMCRVNMEGHHGSGIADTTRASFDRTIVAAAAGRMESH